MAMQPSITPLMRHFEPEAMALLRGLELKARYVVEGYLSGLHQSAFHGVSTEFREYREYHPGDDLRYLDWRVYARSELQQDDAFQPGGKRSLDRGIEHLESLLQSRQDGRRLSAEDRKKLQQEALTDIEKGIENLDSDTKSSGRVYQALREFYTPGVTVNPKVIQRLIEQLENLNVELVEVRSEEPGEPEIRHIDPEKLPQAYRERIRKYFEKLSEQ